MRRKGQGIVEYAVILGLIALVVVFALGAMGISVGDVYAAIVQALGGEVDCKTYYHSDFGTPPTWTEIKNSFWGKFGSWQVQDGKLVSPRSGAMLLNEYSGSDYNISLSGIRLENHASAWNGYGVMFRSSLDAKNRLNGYMFEFERRTRKEPVTMYFSYWVNGTQVVMTPPGKMTIPANSGWDNPANLSISVQGDTFVASMNGKKIMEVTDPKNLYTEGAVGLASNAGSSIVVDDVAVKTPGCEE
jgi:Flp pilus assembly pilin Flp